MIQTLVLIASIVVLASAILTGTLVSAKNALHQAVIAKTQTAMTDATLDFTTWAQGHIAKSGTELNWTGATQPILVAKPMCAAQTTCAFYETTSWIVTGATTGTKPQPTAGQTVSTVRNMAQSVDEQRLSATISVVISDATGKHVYGGRTQELTARLFEAPPYIVVTGVRDLSSESGVAVASEGDSGGAAQAAYGHVKAVPSVDEPYAYTDTVLRTTIDCSNTTIFDQGRPFSVLDHGDGLIITERSGGSQSWSFQLPCEPTYGVPAAPSGSINYVPPAGTVYQVGNSDNSTAWTKGDDQKAAFPK